MALTVKNHQTLAICPLLNVTIHAKNNHIVRTNIPTLNEMADFSPSGMELIIFLLKGTIVNNTQSNPDQKTIPSACCQVNQIIQTTTKAKNPFISNPGATAKGSLAHNPIIKVANPDAIIVAKVTASTLIPVLLRIAGFTMKIYDKLRKVQIPANISLLKFVSISFTPK